MRMTDDDERVIFNLDLNYSDDDRKEVKSIETYYIFDKIVNYITFNVKNLN